MTWNSRYCFTKIIPIDPRRESRDFAIKITKIVGEHKTMNNKSVYAIKRRQARIGYNATMNKSAEALIGTICNVRVFKTKILKI